MISLIEFIMTKLRLKRLRGHDAVKRKKHRKTYRSSLICPVCGLEFKENDLVVMDGKIYLHKQCEPRFRLDSDIEVSDEELENFFTIIV
jgi:hypothetical protein